MLLNKSLNHNLPCLDWTGEWEGEKIEEWIAESGEGLGAPFSPGRGEGLGALFS